MFDSFFCKVMYGKANPWYFFATNLSFANLLLPYDPKYKAGNMSSWWGPTWISVRCGGISEWTSSPIGSAQTQRRAQMRPPTQATPKHPCQVKTTPSEPQIDRQAASMPAVMHGQSGARQGNQRFSLPLWFDPVRNINIGLIIQFRASVLVPLPLVGTYPIYPPATCPERSTGINCPTFSWWSGAGFSRCLSLSVLSPSHLGGSHLEAACLVCAKA